MALSAALAAVPEPHSMSRTGLMPSFWKSVVNTSSPFLSRQNSGKPFDDARSRPVVFPNSPPFWPNMAKPESFLDPPPYKGIDYGETAPKPETLNLSYLHI